MNGEVKQLGRIQFRYTRYDCAFVEQDSKLEGFRELFIACVHSFLLIWHHGIAHPCALVMVLSGWRSTLSCTRMWKVKPDLDDLGNPMLDIIHLDSVLRNAHLMGVLNMPSSQQSFFKPSM